MTKEELEKEAEEYVKKILEGTEFEDDDMNVCTYTKREMLEAILHFAEPREKRIAELEEKLTEKVTLESLDVVSGKITELEEAKANLEYLLEGRDNEIADLEKKNKVLAQNLEDTEIINAGLKKKLKEELKTIADKDLSFVARFDALEKENAELKADNDARKFAMAMSEKVEKKLRKENAELKETLKTYNGCGDWDNAFHTCRVYLQHEELQERMEQLTKAKKLLAKWVELFKPKSNTALPTPIQVETEQFLNSEVKK